MSRLAVLLALLALGLTGCADSADEPGSDRPAVTAPTAVEAGSETLVLSLYAWRDQMPVVGDDPGPCASLCVNGTVETRSGEPLPEGLEVLDVVAVVDGGRSTFEEQEPHGLSAPGRYEFVARRGPVVELGTDIDVSVLLSFDGTEVWLRGENVAVQRTS